MWARPLEWGETKAAANPGGAAREWEGGVESLEGIDISRVEALPQGVEISGVDTEDDGVTGEEGQGRGGYGNPPTTRASEDSRADDGKDGMERKLRMAADNKSAGTLPHQSDGANNTRSKNGMHLHRKYDLLASEAPEGGRANAGTSARGDDHGATRETKKGGRAETPTEEETRQCALQARSR